jgi:kynurenine formamidase
VTYDTVTHGLAPHTQANCLIMGQMALLEPPKVKSGAWSGAGTAWSGAGTAWSGRGAALLLVTVAACQVRDDTTTGVSSGGLDLTAYEIVDLTHALNEQTIFWPTSPTTFKLDRLAYGPTPGGYFYSANAFSMPEHGGTHLDAPIHFAEGAHTTDAIPLDRLVAPAVVIDVTQRAGADPDYRLSAADVEAWEGEHGRIPHGAMVLLRTGWSQRWPDRKSYLGDDTPGDASRLRFPSYGEDAARVLVEQRRVVALGADVASIDYGRSTDFLVHRVAAAANVPGLENLTALERLPATGATVIALLIKIEGGSGGPVRVIALVPRAR